jgi:hypothetical protein
VVILLGGALWLTQSARTPERSVLSFERNGVQVEVLMRQAADRTVDLSAVFTPQPGFHMYSVDLPAEGLGGLGRPTRFDLTAPAAVQVQSELTVTPRAIKVESNLTADPIPIYPAGPVRLTRHLRLVSPSSALTLDAHFSYMSCDDARGCTVPVRNHHERIVLRGIR